MYYLICLLKPLVSLAAVRGNNAAKAIEIKNSPNLISSFNLNLFLDNQDKFRCLNIF